MMKKLTLLLSLLAVAAGCESHRFRLTKALIGAGENRSELQKVLDHYQDDPLKRKAAEFLILNMDGQRTLDTTSVTEAQPYYEALIRYLEKYEAYGTTGAVIVCDSIRARMKTRGPLKASYLSDLSVLSSQFLIDHIDRSFKAWRESSWASDLDFDDFCRFILPYKCDDSHWDGAYDYLHAKYAGIADSLSDRPVAEIAAYVESDIKASFTEDGTFFQKYPFLMPMSQYNYMKARIGSCVQSNNMIISALRSLGIPATLDMIPYWGNSNAAHTWTEVLTDPVSKKYDNEQVPYLGDSSEIVKEMFWFRTPPIPLDGLPEQVSVQYCRTVPKVYRHLFSRAEKRLVPEPEENMPELFKAQRIEDISPKYLECADVTVDLDRNGRNDRYAYLCCYNPDEISWVPVACAEVSRAGRAVFRDMGKNIVYLPGYYDRGRIVPAAAPLLVHGDGTVETLRAGADSEPDVVLFSKMPYRGQVLFYASLMQGGRFQLANREDMRDTLTVHTIRRIPYYGQEVEIADAPASRYGVYNFGSETYGFIASLEFWGPDENGKEVRLRGKPIGNPGQYGFTTDMIDDDDRVSFFFRHMGFPQDYVGFDFGRPRKVTRIRYHPRSDDNGIVPGSLYELFCWDGEWKSLGRQTGRDDKTLVFHGIPKNVLMRIENLTEGTENRIFVYRDGKQLFY